MRPIATILMVLLAAPASATESAGFAGVVVDGAGAAVEGALVSVSYGDPLRIRSSWTDADGRFAAAEIAGAGSYALRVRRLGWRDHWVRSATPGEELSLVLERETDPVALAAQLPANRWFGLLLARMDDTGEREELVRQCTYCHQQGNAATRVRREDWQWDKVLSLMARMGGLLSPELRAKVPDLFRAAYDPAVAVPALTARMGEPDFAPPPEAAVRQAVVEEWELGERASMQHDLVVHPDGRIYSVDMMQDKLYRLDPEGDGVAMEVFDVPAGDLPLGGIFGGGGQPLPPSANAHQGPHSVQVAPDGSVWTTLALGNELGRFDPATGGWSRYPLPAGFYPHTLRFDGEGRVWFTVAVSNHVAMFDPRTGEFESVRLPARTWSQALGLRLLPLFLWANRTFDLGEGVAEGGGGGMIPPVPYGIDVASDGTIWFSQLNEHRIGRLDPETWDYEMIDTPFTAPRRLRFDSRGRLWIPGFSSGVIARFDPETREFKTWDLPIEPIGSETPYALNVDRVRGHVWICGTNSDTLIRFEPDAERWTVYPLPTRVTYTREIDFDERGRVWTSNSNLPTWQVEGGFPRVLRLDPGMEPAPEPSASNTRERSSS
jgi:virginiamycin B lyase